MKKRPPKKGTKVEKLQRLLLVDGNSLFKRSITGAKDLYNSEGIHIGGVFQFITTLRKIINDEIYHKVIVFWDGKFSGKLRYNIYKDYKANRNKDFISGTEPVDVSEQYQKLRIKKYLEILFIDHYEDEVVEADDCIAYLCNNVSKYEITLVTSDKDLFQLLNSKVRIYYLKDKKYLNLDNINENLGYHYKNLLLLKIMCGDSSDNIKGIKSLGDKTLIKMFPEIKEKQVHINSIIKKSELLNNERINDKKKPLVSLINITKRITDGIQGERIYDINKKLIDLSEPMITNDVKNDIKNLFNKKEIGEYDLKNIYELMKEDGIYFEIRKYDSNYILPFKQLINRQKNN